MHQAPGYIPLHSADKDFGRCGAAACACNTTAIIRALVIPPMHGLSFMVASRKTNLPYALANVLMHIPNAHPCQSCLPHPICNHHPHHCLPCRFLGHCSQHLLPGVVCQRRAPCLAGHDQACLPAASKGGRAAACTSAQSCSRSRAGCPGGVIQQEQQACWPVLWQELNGSGIFAAGTSIWGALDGACAHTKRVSSAPCTSIQSCKAKSYFGP